MRYILVGPEPPPLGGISVFLYRYESKLRGEGHQVELLDLSKLRLVRKLVAQIRKPTSISIRGSRMAERED